MVAEWNPAEPVEVFILQIDDGVDFANDGGETIADPTIVPMAYTVVEKTGAICLDLGQLSMDSGASKLVLDREWFCKLTQR